MSFDKFIVQHNNTLSEKYYVQPENCLINNYQLFKVDNMKCISDISDKRIRNIQKLFHINNMLVIMRQCISKEYKHFALV